MEREDARSNKIESAAQKAETANPDLIRLALEWRDRYGYRFRLTHIYAHTGGSDERSVKNHKVGRLEPFFMWGEGQLGNHLFLRKGLQKWYMLQTNMDVI